jgi:hypothetical protein
MYACFPCPVSCHGQNSAYRLTSNRPARSSTVSTAVPLSHPALQIYGPTLNAFLGAFSKLRKVIVSFVMSVCPSVAWNCAPTERIFTKFGI